MGHVDPLHTATGHTRFAESADDIAALARESVEDVEALASEGADDIKALARELADDLDALLVFTADDAPADVNPARRLTPPRCDQPCDQ